MDHQYFLCRFCYSNTSLQIQTVILDYFFSIYYQSGMTALLHASSNGHIKVEKHLWLFNWNMEIVAGLQHKVAASSKTTGGRLSEEDQLALEIQMTSRKYKNQYKTNTRRYLVIRLLDCHCYSNPFDSNIFIWFLLIVTTNDSNLTVCPR